MRLKLGFGNVVNQSYTIKNDADGRHSSDFDEFAAQNAFDSYKSQIGRKAETQFAYLHRNSASSYTGFTDERSAQT